MRDPPRIASGETIDAALVGHDGGLPAAADLTPNSVLMPDFASSRVAAEITVPVNVLEFATGTRRVGTDNPVGRVLDDGLGHAPWLLVSRLVQALPYYGRDGDRRERRPSPD